MAQSQGRMPKVSTKPATKTPQSTLAHARRSSTPLIKKTTYRPAELQGPFPAEIWLWIIGYLSALDLFSLYNTSATLRVLTVPSLVQVIASKSVRLFFYQEYVCRTGITFVFDHFDFTRNKVVFKPQSTHHTITFQNGITIQRPQLEEISVISRGSRCQGGQVVCSEEGIYSICKEVEGSSPVAGRTSSRSRGGQDASDRNEYHFENRFSMLNYMDRVCALNIKRAGRRFLSGKKYSFGHNYPWALHYVIDDKPCGGNSIQSNGIGGATPHFPFDIPNTSNNNNEETHELDIYKLANSNAVSIFWTPDEPVAAF
ncbi:hypothetical protein BGX21_003458 [Mortierella sp. AD011]|nr:hypothetical protein BGX21_003458 [Mortierella sp. AD011]